jgi:hypothetical protein
MFFKKTKELEAKVAELEKELLMAEGLCEYLRDAADREQAFLEKEMEKQQALKDRCEFFEKAWKEESEEKHRLSKLLDEAHAKLNANVAEQKA